MQATYNDLVKLSEPVICGTFTAFDLESMGFPHEAARRGDEVAFIAGDIRARTTIVGVTRDYAQRGKDVFQFGVMRDSMLASVSKIKRDLSTTDTKAAAGAAIAQANKSLLEGYIDTMATHIQSSGTNLYTDPNDGGLVLENAAGTAVVKLTGAGILIANAKVGDVWQWTTAIDGSGMVADAIKTGILQANLIKILGTDRFYWDAGNIYIIDPENVQKQIRIGLYDGTNYGIAFTADGGTTWQTAIGFNGIVLGVGSVTADTLDETLEGRIDSFVNKTEYAEDALTRYGADGSFGAETLAALRQFQTDKGLSVDGVCGEKTQAAITAALASLEPPDEPAAPDESTNRLFIVTIPGVDAATATYLVETYEGAQASDYLQITPS